MKKLLLIILTSFVLIACNKDDDNNNNNCNFLIDVNVNYPVYLSLEQGLNLTQSPVLIPNIGNGGIVVMKTIGENYVAWDNADPNHAFQSSCSIMTLQGTTVTYNCDDENTYDLNTGLPLTQGLGCTLKPYRVEVSSDVIRIFN